MRLHHPQVHWLHPALHAGMHGTCRIWHLAIIACAAHMLQQALQVYTQDRECMELTLIMHILACIGHKVPTPGRCLQLVAMYTLLLVEGAVLPSSDFVIVREAGDDVFKEAASLVSSAVMTAASISVHVVPIHATLLACSSRLGVRQRLLHASVKSMHAHTVGICTCNSQEHACKQNVKWLQHA